MLQGEGRGGAFVQVSLEKKQKQSASLTKSASKCLLLHFVCECI